MRVGNIMTNGWKYIESDMDAEIPCIENDVVVRGGSSGKIVFKYTAKTYNYNLVKEFYFNKIFETYEDNKYEVELI